MQATTTPEKTEADASKARTHTPNRATRTIKISDVVKALEIAAERLGDTERSCATLRAWSAAGRVTPGGQVLVREVVDAAIESWLAQKAMADSCATKKPDSTKRSADNSAAAVAKRQKNKYAEAKQGRLNEEARMRDLAKDRLTEVLKEMGSNMGEILRRTNAKAFDEWNSASVDCDRRGLYMRLVHSIQANDVTVPEELCAELLFHQVEGLEWLASLYANKLHGILADEMGLGKTIQTITFLLHLQEKKGNCGPHLVVAPKSTLPNWEAEFKKFAPKHCVRVLVGDQDERDAVIAAVKQDIASGKATTLVTNFEQVHRNEWLTQNQWQVIVVDEGHRLKNPETVLHNAMKQLNCRMRLLLTGTPLQNSLNELWALLHYLLPELFTCLMDFKTWFSTPFKGIEGMNEYDVKLDAEQEQEVITQMHTMLAPFLLQRLKSEVLRDKLPEKVEVEIRVPLSAWQASAYKDLEKRTIKLLGDDDSVSSEKINNALMQLRKIVLHPYLFQDQYYKDDGLYRTSGKVEALDRILTKLLHFKHKVLIFSQFTSVLDILENFLSWKGVKNVRLDGQVQHAQRRERIDRFNADPNISVFLLSARAGGLGLNLQSADTVILFDLDWNPQNDKQAVARVHRVGQTKEVRVIRLLSDSAVERHIEKRCSEKLEMEKKIMGAGMFRKQATTEDRRQALREVLGIGANTSDAAASSSSRASDVTTPEDLSRLIARGDEEASTFLDMDAALLRRGRAPQQKRKKADESCVSGDVNTSLLLEKCGRLLRPQEVPDGFSAIISSED